MKTKKRRIRFKAYLLVADVQSVIRKLQNMQSSNIPVSSQLWYDEDVHATITVEWTEK